MDLKGIVRREWKALLDRLPRPLAQILRLSQQTVKGFVVHEGSARAATIAYYAFFSSFPLVLFVITSSSYLLEDQVTQQEIYTYFESYAPQTSGFVRANIEQVLNARGTINLIAIIALLWSASGMFSAISHAVNRAWGIERPRPFWEEKLLALGMVLTVSLLFLLSVATSVVVGLLSQLPLVKTDLASFDSLLWSVLSIVLPVSFMFVLLTLIYRLMPNTEVRWRVALTGAALATIAWEVAKEAFTFYLAHFARYELLYGQMEVFIILLLYFYFVGVILLMGAEFTAAYTRLLQEDSGSESSALRRK